MRRIPVLIWISIVLLGLIPAPTHASSTQVIYVGQSDDLSPLSSCDDPDYSTDNSDEQDINHALEAAFAALTRNDNLIIICEGSYDYYDDIEPFFQTQSRA